MRAELLTAVLAQLDGVLVTLPARAATPAATVIPIQVGRLQSGQRPAPADGQLGGRDAVRRSAGYDVGQPADPCYRQQQHVRRAGGTYATVREALS
jgi:hypothetical protein